MASQGVDAFNHAANACYLPVTCPQLGTPTIFITSDILGFLGYEGLLRSKLGRGKKVIKKELKMSIKK